MPGKRERYLAQQAELGGNEVVLSTEYWVLSTKEDSESAAAKAADGPDSRVQETPPASYPTQHSVPSTQRSPPVRTGPRTAAKAKGEGAWKKDAPPIPGPGLSVISPAPSLIDDVWSGLASLEAVASTVAACRKCFLCEGRTNTVPGEGNPQARLVFVGEGPGATEDETGRPFVGMAGELLDKLLAAIDIACEDVFIANIVKCRPPQNRKPLPDEVAACLPYLHRQIALIRPKVIVALGGTAAEALLGVKKSLGDLRGKVHRFDGLPLIVTYHPAALLRNPNWKKPTWDDIRIARLLLDG